MTGSNIFNVEKRDIEELCEALDTRTAELLERVENVAGIKEFEELKAKSAPLDQSALTAVVVRRPLLFSE